MTCVLNEKLMVFITNHVGFKRFFGIQKAKHFRFLRIYPTERPTSKSKTLSLQKLMHAAIHSLVPHTGRGRLRERNSYLNSVTQQKFCVAYIFPSSLNATPTPSLL